MIAKEIEDTGILEEGIKVDFIHADTDYVGDTDFKECVDWTLTIDVGEKDDKNYIDAILVNFKKEDYHTFFNDDLKYTIKQLPSNNWDEEKVSKLLNKYKERIEEIISDFCEEHESQNMD